MARPFSVVGLRGFAQEMMRRWQEAEQEVEGRCDATEAAVQIITVHSAKGLEWPVVIPVNMCTGMKATQGVLYSSRNGTLHCKAGNIEPPSYAIVKEEEAEQRRAGKHPPLVCRRHACTGPFTAAPPRRQRQGQNLVRPGRPWFGETRRICPSAGRGRGARAGGTWCSNRADIYG